MQNLNIIPFLLAFFFLIGCEEVVEDPDSGELIVSDFTATIDENPERGQVIGTIDVSTNAEDLTFSLTAEDPEGAIEVNDSTGEITVADPDLFVFEDHPQFTATVAVSNDSVSKDVEVLITINEPEEDTGDKQPTIWTGEKITFTKEDGANPELAANQDRITDTVWITRRNDGGPIYNIKEEIFGDNGPSGTEWALGTIDDIESLSFTSLKAALGDPSERGLFHTLPGKTLVLHLLEDNIYLEVTFKSWSNKRAGGFSYERSTE